MMRTRGLAFRAALGLVLYGFLGYAPPASACACVVAETDIAWPTLEQAAAKSEAVLIGRVRAQQPAVIVPSRGAVPFLDVEVVHNLKGLGSVPNAPCGEYVRVLGSRDEAAKLAKRLRKVLRKPSKIGAPIR
jgi:hypothetical protein